MASARASTDRSETDSTCWEQLPIYAVFSFQVGKENKLFCNPISEYVSENVSLQ